MRFLLEETATRCYNITELLQLTDELVFDRNCGQADGSEYEKIISAYGEV